MDIERLGLCFIFSDYDFRANLCGASRGLINGSGIRQLESPLIAHRGVLVSRTNYQVTPSAAPVPKARELPGPNEATRLPSRFVRSHRKPQRSLLSSAAGGEPTKNPACRRVSRASRNPGSARAANVAHAATCPCATARATRRSGRAMLWKYRRRWPGKNPAGGPDATHIKDHPARRLCPCRAANCLPPASSTRCLPPQPKPPTR
jgi:hypothetical protein